MKCDHEWVDMKDGTNDKFCIRCSNKAKQAVMGMDFGTGDITVNVTYINRPENSIGDHLDRLSKQIHSRMGINFLAR